MRSMGSLIKRYSVTCFASTNVQILTPEILDSGCGSQDSAERSGGEDLVGERL